MRKERTEAISIDLDRQEVSLKELHIDRAYLSSHLVRERSDELEVYCKAWPVRQGKRFSKQAFTLLHALHEAGYTWQKSRTWCKTGITLRKNKDGVVEQSEDPYTQEKNAD